MSSIVDKKTTGNVFSIQKYSVHDGPGIRTIVFLKGCPLSCLWCSNPESQKTTSQLAYNSNKCLGLDKCTRCLNVCGENAIAEGEDGKIAIDREKCTDCLKCADACPAGALIVYGEETSVDDALKRVEEDELFYARSGGGLTLSGGEPFNQPKFAIAILREARARHINTAVETCGHADWEVLEQALPYVNTLMYDIKSMDPETHKKFTGMDNKRILENLKRIRENFPNLAIRVRTPVVPGFNDSEEAIAEIIKFISALPGDKVEYEALEYHRMGQPKYINLGKTYGLPVDLKLDAGLFQKIKKMEEDFNNA